jgi:hypothetical protein
MGLINTGRTKELTGVSSLIFIIYRRNPMGTRSLWNDDQTDDHSSKMNRKRRRSSATIPSGCSRLPMDGVYDSVESPISPNTHVTCLYTNKFR